MINFGHGPRRYGSAPPMKYGDLIFGLRDLGAVFATEVGCLDAPSCIPAGACRLLVTEHTSLPVQVEALRS